MSTMRHTAHDRLTRSTEEQFADVVCSDEDWVRAEFEAIIAAEWPAPPSRPPAQRAASAPPTAPDGPWRVSRLERLASQPRRPGAGGWARQRSPPAW